MRPTRAPHERPVVWVASSKRDLLAMPTAVVREFGMALGVAQLGGRHPAAKHWRGAGSGVLEVVSDFEGSTFRAVYAVCFADAVYVLHCFQKKSPRGVATARPDVQLIRSRLRMARLDFEARHERS